MRIAILNQKGGSGKTTTAVNLCAALEKLGHSSTLIDMDPQAHATKHLLGPVPAGIGTYDLLNGTSGLQGVLTYRSKIGIIPSSLDLSGADYELLNTTAREMILKDAIKDLRGFVVIDCPPSLGFH